MYIFFGQTHSPLFVCIPETDACECSVAGGMHFHTCDEQWLDFQGDCTYTLMKAGNDSGLEPFQIDISTKHISTEDKMAYVRDVIIEVYNYRIALTFDYGIIVSGFRKCQIQRLVKSIRLTKIH